MAFLSSSPVIQADELRTLHMSFASIGGAHGLTAPLARAANCTPDALPFLRAVRACCAAAKTRPKTDTAKTATAPAWVADADSAALSVLHPLYSPLLTRVVTLRAEAAVGSSAAALVLAARKGESVRPTTDTKAWGRKFGTRRVAFSLVHVAVPAEPLAFLFSALMAQTPASFLELDTSTGAPTNSGRSWQLKNIPEVSEVYDGAAPGAGTNRLSDADADLRLSPPTAAVFYSVSAVAAHTKGLQLGQRLLFQGAATLAATLPSLTSFATLSPVPGFAAWLTLISSGGGGDARDALETALNNDAAAVATAKRGARSTAADAAAALLPWTLDPTLSLTASPAARALTSAALRHYLLKAGGAKPLCPVAAFHFANGATLARLCGGADISKEGGQRSGGFCVNYEYSRDGAEGLARAQLYGMEAWARAQDTNSMAVLDAQRPEVLWV